MVAPRTQSRALARATGHTALRWAGLSRRTPQRLVKYAVAFPKTSRSIATRANCARSHASSVHDGIQAKAIRLVEGVPSVPVMGKILGVPAQTLRS